MKFCISSVIFVYEVLIGSESLTEEEPTIQKHSPFFEGILEQLDI